MKKFASISICIFVFISFVLNVPYLFSFFMTRRTFETISTNKGVYPVVNASRFSECVVDALEVCSYKEFYDSMINYNESEDIKNGYFLLVPYSITRPLLEDLFTEALDDLGFTLPSEYDDQFLTYVFELAVVKYYNPSEYYSLLRTYDSLRVEGGF